MPVRVRCPACQKVLNAPDAARGKAVKCPGCGTAVRVPAAAAAGAAAGGRDAAAASPGDLNFAELAAAERRAASACPICAEPIDEGAPVCPHCGASLRRESADALARAARAQRRAALTMAAPEQRRWFYHNAWKDALSFTLDGKFYLIVGSALGLIGAGICVGMLFFLGRHGGPDSVPTGELILAGIAQGAWLLASIGFYAHLYRAVIRESFAGIQHFPEHISWEFWDLIVQGIVMLMWIMMYFAVPIGIVAAMIALDSVQTAGIVATAAVGFLIALTAPVALTYASMGKFARSLAAPAVMAPFGRALVPLLFWWAGWLVVNLPTLGAAAGTFFLMRHLDLSHADVLDDPLKALLPLGAIVFVWVLLNFTQMMAARALGLLTYTFHKELEFER